MSTDTNRKELLRKLSRNLMVSVPVMTVVAMAGATAVSDNGFSLIPSAEAAQGEAEGEAKGEGEAEGEGVSEAMKQAVRRPEGYQPYEGDADSLAKKGETLFNDTTLSSNGLACATCHTNGAGYADTFSNDYPHFVAMGKSDFGMDMVHLDEMVQICMVAPMASQPLDWASEELAALTEYMRIEQEKFRNK
ncbi:MAG: hypothetical protein RIK85_13715 [Marinobacter sp.]